MVRPTPSYLAHMHVRLVDAALVHQVFDQAADGVVGERGDDGGLEAEAAAQAAGDVVLAAAFPDVELRAVATRTSPGSRRSMTSPRETRSHLHSDWGGV